MITPRRLALFAPSSPLFVHVLQGLRRAFTALGVDAQVATPLPDGRTLEAFVANWRPDVVIEINRSRNAIVDCDASFIHVAWIHDHRYAGRPVTHDMGGGAFTFFMMPPDLLGIDEAVVPGDWDLLLPGTDPEFFFERPTAKRWDMSLVGHMYPPLTPALLDMPLVGSAESGVLASGAGGGLTVGEALDRVLDGDMDSLNRGIGDLRGRLDRLMPEGAPEGGDVVRDPASFDQEVLSLFDEIGPRLRGRARLAELMSRVSSRIAFFGSPGWGLWPEFASRYHGEILDQGELADIYRATTLNPHYTLWPLHFRTLDCMACGGCVMVNRTTHPAIASCWDRDFVEGEHYLGCADGDFVEVARRALADPGNCDRIGARAAALVRAKHTWAHRAAEICRVAAAL